jgi:hypothetical protein
MPRRAIVHFGSGPLDLPGLVRRRNIAVVVKAAAAGALGALVVDARTADDLFRALALLRALYDDPRSPRRSLDPARVVAVIAAGDVEAAFAFGRYGIAGVIPHGALADLEPRLRRILASTPVAAPLAVPALAPARSTHLGPRGEGQLPTVTVGYRHAPETLAALARYVHTLRAQAHLCAVFADVATLIEVMVDEGLTCQTNLATKAGATHTGQFIGSFEFYRELRRTRYRRIPDHPRSDIAMDVFIAVDEVLHEVLHLLFLANEARAGIAPQGTLLAEELSLTWWQAVVHNRVFPEWLAGHDILEINDDFMLSESNQESRKFWSRGTVFEQYAGYPWVAYVLSRLPARASYIGQRPDLDEVIAAFASRPEAAFLLADAARRLALPIPFDAYPPVPETLRLAAPSTRGPSSQTAL